VADGAIEAIRWLREQGIEVSIVAELKRTLGPIGTDMVSNFLVNQGVIQYFDELISPQGKIDLRTGEADLRYKGTSKEEGNLYDVLVEDLRSRGIEPKDAIMVGDKEWSDITPAQKRGFQAIHYSGYIYHAPSHATFEIRHLSELKTIIRPTR
jgi:phosphoglycolate phosphatase-like HAD superfamily hydrolase